MLLMSLFLKETDFFVYLEMPSSPALLLHRPWTLITYMFVHFDFLHILFNMLWLYTFGKIFLQFFTGRQLGGLYVLGGMAGALFFLVAYNVFPYFSAVSSSSFLVGASASVMAIVFAVSFYQKDYRLNLLFLGRLKLIYLAIAALVIDILAITSENAGGHIAHIGGALLGILFASQYGKGKDITNFINRWIDNTVNLFSRKPGFKVYRNKNYKSQSARRPETDDEYRRRKNAEEREIDHILDKLKRSGYESLSSEEKKTLFNASKK
jgi:membrane associated rhomboid family serine protease